MADPYGDQGPFPPLHDLPHWPVWTSELRGDCAFSIAGPNLWNSLPFSLRLVSSESEFKSKLKTYLSNYQTCSYLFVFLARFAQCSGQLLLFLLCFINTF